MQKVFMENYVGLVRENVHNTAFIICLLYSIIAAEYCVPVWSRSAHTSQVDVQLNSTMH